jgi:uncharacterized membrane protein HdeD (DUF308 family)
MLPHLRKSTLVSGILSLIVGSVPDPGRAWSIFVGAISLFAGIVVIASPFDSIVTLALVVGIWFVVIGVFEIISSFGIRKASQTLERQS